MIKGSHWSEEDLNKIKGYSSIIVNIVSSEKSRDYPHKTEDCWINEDIQLRHSYDDLSSLAKDLQSSVSKTIASIFNWKIKKKQYVPAKTKCASLGAVALSTHNIEFYKDDNSKLRIKIQDTDNNDYDLRVTCKYLRDKFEKTKKCQ
jgi:hypothetical protein